MKKLPVVLTSIFILTAAVTSYAANILYFTSSPTSWVGNGQTLTFASPTTAFSTRRYFTQGAYTNAVTLHAGDALGYNLTIVGPNKTLPVVGFYANATRWPFMDSGAGLSFRGNGRGDNTLTGYFNVLQADYDINGNIVSFAVDFMQYDECVTADWVSGSFRYNSNIPVPEPTTIALLTLGGLALSKRK
jgi:hypothetical protein